MRVLSIVLASCIIASLLCGCEGKTQYKVLSFFFDGVPDPEKQDMVSDRDKKRPGQPKIEVRTGSVHGPYSSRSCSSCHNKDTNSLLLPVTELCFKCHSPTTDKKYVHGPVSSGGCLVCHNPHESAYPFLLVTTAQVFCFYCHSEKVIGKIEAHKGAEGGCTTCHEPHASNRRFLLK